MRATVVEQLADWYNLLDLVDRKEVDEKFAAGEYSLVDEKFRTSPGYPTEGTVQWD